MERGEDPIRRLPSGPHGLPPELIERNQRERLIAAMAEVCGERGYGETSIAEVAKRAGVSTASFYRQFADKRECLLVAFKELFGRLLDSVREACEEAGDAEQGTRAGIEIAAQLLAEDPLTARLLSIEILAVGEGGVAAQHDAVACLAALLRGSDATIVDGAWSSAAAMVALVARESARGRGPSRSNLEALANPP